MNCCPKHWWFRGRIWTCKDCGTKWKYINNSWRRRHFDYKRQWGLNEWEFLELSQYNTDKNKYVFNPNYIKKMEEFQSRFDKAQERRLIEQGYSNHESGLWYKKGSPEKEV